MVNVIRFRRHNSPCNYPLCTPRLFSPLFGPHFGPLSGPFYPVFTTPFGAAIRPQIASWPCHFVLHFADPLTSSNTFSPPPYPLSLSPFSPGECINFIVRKVKKARPPSALRFNYISDSWRMHKSGFGSLKVEKGG